MYKRLINYISSGIIVLFILFIPESCTLSGDQNLLKSGHTGGLLKDIKSRGKIVALTDDNSFSYFTLNDEPEGIQYNLLKQFAEHLGVTLEIIVEPNVYKALQYLQQKRVDIIAMELPRITEPNFDFMYTEPLYTDYQVLVQRKPKHWYNTRNIASLESQMINSLEELNEQTVTLAANKQVHYYLSDIQHATNNTVNFSIHNDPSISNLIEEVSKGTVQYSISFEKKAKAMMLLHSNIDAHTRVSPPIEISWIVRKGATNLLETANEWITSNQESKQFRQVFTKYYNSPRWVSLALGKSVKNKVISDYDDIIREMSKSIGWDWRLVAALIYHESKFQTDVISHRGAFGLMQLMPTTASRFGVHIGSTPNEQIAAGVRLLNYLDKRLSSLVPNNEERRKFVLAAYNIGLAHILDAYNLTEKYNRDPEVWFGNVEYFLLAKSQPEYYNDTVVKYGKISGKETHKFVVDVMDRYDYYKSLALK